MTDGRHSHSRYMEASQLARLRAHEALDAGQVLGLDEVDLVFLNFEDSRLQLEREAAVVAVRDLLCSWRPQEVYIPYSQEPPPDHAATHEIVQTAINQL